jgi:hypothetical protein
VRTYVVLFITLLFAAVVHAQILEPYTTADGRQGRRPYEVPLMPCVPGEPHAPYSLGMPSQGAQYSPSAPYANEHERLCAQGEGGYGISACRNGYSYPHPDFGGSAMAEYNMSNPNIPRSYWTTPITADYCERFGMRDRWLLKHPAMQEQEAAQVRAREEQIQRQTLEHSKAYLAQADADRQAAIAAKTKECVEANIAARVRAGGSPFDTSHDAVCP